MAYQCLTGYEAVGKPEVYCMKTGEWSLPEFKCVIGKTKVVNPISLFTFCVYDDLMSWYVGYRFYFWHLFSLMANCTAEVIGSCTMYVRIFFCI